MSEGRPNAFLRLFRGETSFDFAGRWKTWFAISGLIILIGIISLSTRGLNFSIEFKGGTVWEVASSATVSEARSAINNTVPGMGQATITVLTNTQTGQRTIKVEAGSDLTANSEKVSAVTAALAELGHVSTNEVQLNDIGPSWGHTITDHAIRAVIIFLIVVSGYIWLRFEGKMAFAALVALVHDILITAGIYSLSGFQVSPDTVIAFLTILGYSLYDTIVVFDRVQENTRGLASTNRMTYSDTLNLSMNQVLARSVNTSLVAILPILSILVVGGWILGATALLDFGLALFIGLTTGAYSSLFIASPLLALMKEREPRYYEIRRRLANSPSSARRMTPAEAAGASLAELVAMEDGDPVPVVTAPRSARAEDWVPEDEQPYGADAVDADGALPPGAGQSSNGDPGASAIPLRQPANPTGGTRPPPRPRKKGRRR